MTSSAAPVPLTPPGANSGLPLSFGMLSRDRSGATVHVSGMVGYQRGTGQLVGPGLEEQARTTFDNVVAVLAEAGLDLDHVVQVRIYLADIVRDFAAFNAVYREYFTGPVFPARTAIGVTLADPALLVEVDAVARLGG
ncbi:RidA family protein [Occultella aeris]|uniref:RutC family protein YjgH n=1 Tax=Occultella aeris TaxID=2761496 RepID=A0A7M4DFJ7_9MICO|nr:RidA family protein [Occultella aeris]VZO35690.1 RutC family protein YjgH [Occultella aeris]